MNKEHLHPDGRPYTKEEFVEKIKTDEEFLKRFGNLGKIYGYQWRNWNDNIDQISELINQLKENPDSRRLLVSAWNPADLPNQVLPPCHYGFQVYTREMSVQERQKYDNHFDSLIGEYPDHHITLDKTGVPRRAISLMWNQRSCDFPLGIPMNIASYALLLIMIADEVNMVPDELIGNLGDCHIYLNQVDGVKEQIGRELSLEERKQIFEEKGYVCDVWPFNGDWSSEYDGFGIPTRTREPYPLPTVHVRDGIFCSSVNDVILENYQSHPKIYFPLSN